MPMFRYKLRTLLIVLALGPPLIWAVWAWWPSSESGRLPPPLNTGDIQFYPPGPEFLFDPGGPPDEMIEDWSKRQP